MKLKEFVKKFVCKNTLIRLWVPTEGGHEMMVQDNRSVCMNWELLQENTWQSKCLDHEVIGVTDIVCHDRYKEAVNIVIKEGENTMIGFINEDNQQVKTGKAVEGINPDALANAVAQLQDSGDRTEFESGAVRDMHEGKGRCDLLPACAILRLARHYENGAVKYSDRNWEKGMPTSVMLDSGIRHLLKYLDGMADEDHLAAAAWNILGAMYMEEKHPELQNIPTRPDYYIGKDDK